MTEISTADAPASVATDALVERLFAATIDTLEVPSVYLGGQLGFYRALADGGDATPGELAARTGTAERYVREWLEQQAVAGFLTVDDPNVDAAARRYGLPAAHRAVFVEEDNLNYLTPSPPSPSTCSGLWSCCLTPIEPVTGPLRGLRHRSRPGHRGDQPAAVRQPGR